MLVSLGGYLAVGAVLFALGTFGVLYKKNAIIVLLSIELMLNAVNINLIAFSHYLGNMTGQIFTVFTITVAAAEAAVGLAILMAVFKNRGTIQVKDMDIMKR